jgi:hypothetical protein
MFNEGLALLAEVLFTLKAFVANALDELFGTAGAWKGVEDFLLLWLGLWL